MTCQICTEKYNKTTKKQIECPKCADAFCCACVKKYISEYRTACMSCNGEWDFEFLCKVLSKPFMNTDFKKIQEKKILDKEIALLPDTVYYVEVLNDMKTLRKKKTEMLAKITDMQRQIRDMDDEVAVYRNIIHSDAPKNKIITISDGPCPFENCRGFINKKTYTCAVCSTCVCKDCREIKDKDVEHTCNPENVETTKLLKKDSKPCPKCSVFIFKIDGCDQMWCSQCQTAFSWKTGIIETGKIHNPHYYEWQKMTTGSVARDVDDNPCPRDLPDIRMFRGSDDYIFSLHRTISHIKYALIPQLETTWNNRFLRMDYLRNKISKETFSKELYVRDKKRSRNIAILNCLNIYCENVIEMFHTYLNTKTYSFLDEPKLREFVNGNLEKVKSMYGGSIKKYVIFI